MTRGDVIPHSASFPNGASLWLEKVTKTFPSYDGEKNFTALSEVSFSLCEGDTALIAGANGSGKSVLMSIIASLDTADCGTVKILRGGKAAQCGLVFQEAEMQILGETPLEDVMVGLKNIGMKKKDAERKALDVLAEVGLAGKERASARFLSGGEKRRLAVAGIIALDMPLVIFDEPYANLDYSGVRHVNALIKLLKKKGVTLIILTHELEKSLALCNRFIVLYRGKKVFDGEPAEGLTQKLEDWAVKNPLASYKALRDLEW